MPSSKSFTAEFKIRVCIYAEKNGNHVAAKEFSVEEISVRVLQKANESISQLDPNGKPTKWQELETSWLIGSVISEKQIDQSQPFPYVVKHQA
ncbi:hypothetical protein HZS_2538 [Henneguya salminicola]|nr:hypothetical protein HZS_2538 [Henneguya salminicola]